MRELIGIFILSLLTKRIHIHIHIGLYRDDGLTILKNTSGPEAEKLEKKFQKSFKEKDSNIIIYCNLKITNNLGIPHNLNDGSYRPYRKPNEETNYIYLISDHPPSIIKEIPPSNEERLSILSSSKNIFQESAIFYEKFLKNSGYKTKLQFQQPKVKITWQHYFVQPTAQQVRKNQYRENIHEIGKHFPPNHKF